MRNNDFCLIERLDLIVVSINVLETRIFYWSLNFLNCLIFFESHVPI